MGLLRGMARTAVVAGTATHVSNNVSRRQSPKYSEEDAQQAQDETGSKGGESESDQLEELAEMKAKGIITQKEFDAKKKQILNI